MNNRNRKNLLKKKSLINWKAKWSSRKRNLRARKRTFIKIISTICFNLIKNLKCQAIIKINIVSFV